MASNSVSVSIRKKTAKNLEKKEVSGENIKKLIVHAIQSQNDSKY